MMLYHSSNVAVLNPNTQHSRDNLDFGKGFYLTSIYEQAVSYAQRFLRRNQKGWLNSYELNLSHDEWNIRFFDAYDAEWLDFISKCRAGIDDTDYDMVVGGIANDKVIRTLDRYFDDELTAEQALGILKYEKTHIQYCIRSQRMLDICLKHLESIEL